MDYDINYSVENYYDSPRVVVAGIGEGGCKAVLSIATDIGLQEIRFLLADKGVELSRLRFAKAERINLDVEWREDYRRCLQDATYAFFLVRLGGDLEINAVKIMTAVTADMKVPFVVFAQMPSERFAGMTELKAAKSALETLKGLANASVVIPDDTLFQTIPGDLPVKTACEQATRWFARAVADVVRPFALEKVLGAGASHLEWLVKRKNAVCSVGFGQGEGVDAIGEAIDYLVQSPFWKRSMEAYTVDAALVVLSIGPSVSRDQALLAMKRVRGIFDETIKLETCTCVDDLLAEGVRITVLVRLVEESKPADPPPDEKPNVVKPKRGGRKQKNDERQLVLIFKEDDLGIFSAKEPTIHNGENLDVPTYSRNHIIR